MIHDFGMNF